MSRKARGPPAPPKGEPPKQTLTQSMRQNFSRGITKILKRGNSQSEGTGSESTTTFDNSVASNNPLATPKSKTNAFFRVGNLQRNRDNSNEPYAPPRAPAEERAPQQPNTELSGSALDQSSTFGSSLSLKLGNDIASVFRGAAAELKLDDERRGEVTENIARLREALQSTSSSAALEESLKNLENSINAREKELSSLFQRTEREVEEKLEATLKSGATLPLTSPAATLQPTKVVETRPLRRPGELRHKFRVAVWAVLFSSRLQRVHRFFCQYQLHELFRVLLVAIFRRQPEDPWDFTVKFLNTRSGKGHGIGKFPKVGEQSVLPEHQAIPKLREQAIKACSGMVYGMAINLDDYERNNDILNILQYALTHLGRLQPTDPLDWLRRYFLTRYLGRGTELAPQYIRVTRKALQGQVYWLDLATDALLAKKPEEAGTTDIMELTDGAQMQAVIRDLRRGNIKAEDAVDWVQQHAMREIKMLNSVLRGQTIQLDSTLSTANWAGTLKDTDAELLKQVGYNLQLMQSDMGSDDSSFIEELGQVDAQAVRVLKRVFTSFADATADQVDEAILNQDKYLELLYEIDLITDQHGPVDLDSTLGEAHRSHELTRKDAEVIFELVATALEKRRNSKSPASCPVGDLDHLDFFGFLSALHMISKRMRRPLSSLMSDLTFSNLSPVFRPAFADMSNKGVMRRVRGIFAAFSGGGTCIRSWQWRKLCKDCDLLTKNFSSADADAVFLEVAACNGSNDSVEHKDARQLLDCVAKRSGLPQEDVVGLVAWSFGPKLEVPKKSVTDDEALMDEILKDLNELP